MTCGRPVAAVLCLILSLSTAADDCELRCVRKPDRLYLPTHIEKFGDRYYIVDSYNNRVLFNESLDNDVPTWTALDTTLSRPHSIASNGRLFLVDDTEAHKVNVYRLVNGRHRKIQEVYGVGIRPHRTLYDDKSGAFYVLGADSQTIAKLVDDGGRIKWLYTREIAALEGAYTRSMRIIGDRMYFASGPGRITAVRYLDDSYETTDTWKVPDGYASMNDFAFVGRYVYVTATMNKIIRCPDLSHLARGECEDVYDALSLDGNPYYISAFDGRYYFTEVGHANRVQEITLDEDGEIADVDDVM